MPSGVAQARLGTISPKIISGIFVPLLVTSGLLMALATCMCDVDVSHGHELLQLPTHSHAGAGQVPGYDLDRLSGGITERNLSPEAVPGDECDDPTERVRVRPDGTVYIANGEALESQDSAVPQAPSSPASGPPTAVAQPALTAILDRPGAVLIPTPDQELHGLVPRPEIPPPRVSVAV